MAFPARVPGPQTVLAFVEAVLDVVEKLANDTEDLLLRFDEVVVGIQFTCGETAAERYEGQALIVGPDHRWLKTSIHAISSRNTVWCEHPNYSCACVDIRRRKSWCGESV